jgi:cytochrome c551/c552
MNVLGGPIVGYGKAEMAALSGEKKQIRQKIEQIKDMKKLIMLVVAGLALSTWATNAEEAKAIYDKSCAKCHGADGAGQTKMGQKLGVKNYTDAKVQAAMKDEEMAKAIKEGVKDKDGKPVMKPTEGISDADVKGLVTLIRGFKK